MTLKHRDTRVLCTNTCVNISTCTAIKSLYFITSHLCNFESTQPLSRTVTRDQFILKKCFCGQSAWCVWTAARALSSWESEEKRAPSVVTQQRFQRVPPVKNKRAGGRPTRRCSELPPVSTTGLSAVVWGGTGAPRTPQPPAWPLPPSRQVTLSEMLPETHAIYSADKYCHSVVVVRGDAPFWGCFFF